jgi:hypothetical protein
VSRVKTVGVVNMLENEIATQCKMSYANESKRDEAKGSAELNNFPKNLDSDTANLYFQVYPQQRVTSRVVLQ